MEKPIISVKDLIVGFYTHGKKVDVIRGVSLNVYRGETLAIVGESGSGKSVFTKTFTGMLDANGYIKQGEILFDDMDLAKVAKKSRSLKGKEKIVLENKDSNGPKPMSKKDWLKIRGKRIATIFQDPMTSLNPLFSIGFQISEVLIKHHHMTRKQAKEEAIKLLEKVKIPDAARRYRDFPFQYSGGMRQRVVIAIALACRPEILICDEPTTALDVTVQNQILDLIKELQQEYKWTTIFITHDLGVVANVASRIAVMYGGQIVEYGTSEDIFYRPAHPYTWALLSSLPQLGVKGEPLSYIPGNPPTFSSEIIGDAYAPRNKYALKIDFLKESPMFQISETHFAKTWLLDPRAPKIEKPVVIQELTKRMAAAAKELKREVEE
ncbi:MAG: ABC transporter ATP-binding protein [Erysipelotrichaceae bacterium]|jgi:oligopeptide transport system ATP-binding protein|nr:ABC transporter ATP-binding protein [Erysipelotrichaceae bacterium]